MDNSKTYDTQLNQRNKKSIFEFLDQKEIKVYRKHSNSSVQTEIEYDSRPTVLPNYRFVITSFQIKDHVQYFVDMLEEFHVLKRKMVRKYQFKTRYSMLQALDRKLEIGGLPGKKLFGNKDAAFVERRKSQLEEYLNRAAKNKSLEFLKFVRQIKTTDFNRSLKENFTLEP